MVHSQVALHVRPSSPGLSLFHVLGMKGYYYSFLTSGQDYTGFMVLDENLFEGTAFEHIVFPSMIRAVPHILLICRDGVYSPLRKLITWSFIYCSKGTTASFIHMGMVIELGIALSPSYLRLASSRWRVWLPCYSQGL